MRSRQRSTSRAAAILTGTAAALLFAAVVLLVSGCAGNRGAPGEADVTEKMDLRLRQALDPDQEGTELGDWIQVIVRLTHTASAEDQEALEAYGRVESMVDRFVTLRIPRDAVMKMAAMERVARVELSIPAVPAPVPPPRTPTGEGEDR